MQSNLFVSDSSVNNYARLSICSLLCRSNVLKASSSEPCIFLSSRFCAFLLYGWTWTCHTAVIFRIELTFCSASFYQVGFCKHFSFSCSSIFFHFISNTRNHNDAFKYICGKRLGWLYFQMISWIFIQHLCPSVDQFAFQIIFDRILSVVPLQSPCFPHAPPAPRVFSTLILSSNSWNGYKNLEITLIKLECTCTWAKQSVIHGLEIPDRPLVLLCECRVNYRFALRAFCHCIPIRHTSVFAKHASANKNIERKNL